MGGQGLAAQQCNVGRGGQADPEDPPAPHLLPSFAGVKLPGDTL